MFPERIVSGGQTGVDRAALDVAIECDVEHGGWCPRGRRAEDGVIDEKYELQETPSPRYPVRTKKNVIDSDGTLILYSRELTGGTRLTAQLAQDLNRPLLLIDLSSDEHAASSRIDLARLTEWVRNNEISTLNVAGPRESSTPGVGELAMSFLGEAVRQLRRPGASDGPSNEGQGD